MLGTIRRCGDVFDLFTPETPEWGVREVARRLDMPKSNAHALLSSMADIGVLYRTGDGRYRLGWRLLSLGRIATETADFSPFARRALGRIATCLGETAHLSVWDEGFALVVACHRGCSPGAVAGPAVGARLNAEAFAPGKMLADDHTAALSGCSGTRTATPGIGATYALDHEEALAGVSTVAVPVRDARGDTVAALGVSVASPMSAHRLTGHVRVLIGVARDFRAGAS